MKRIHLWVDGSNVNDNSITREAAISLVNYACDGENGRILGDSVFNEVTENRAGWKGYSGCADLAHWMLFKLGCRNDKLLNRQEFNGWEVGKNVSKLVYGSGNAWVNINKDSLPQPGDVIWIGNDDATTHILVLENFNLDQNVITSFDYGQSYKNKPAGLKRTRKLEYKNNKFYVGTRLLHGFIDLNKLEYIESALVPDNCNVGIPDDNPYY